eukprot:COSAG06_NODE_42182_length_384_cov_0.722807_2_plen_38_part_01
MWPSLLPCCELQVGCILVVLCLSKNRTLVNNTAGHLCV